MSLSEALARDPRGPQAAMCLHQAGFHDLGEFVDLLLDAARAEGVADHLQDPNTVHINMLRGGIAKPTPAQIGHLYRGDEAAEVIREVARQNPEAEGVAALQQAGDVRKVACDHCQRMTVVPQADHVPGNMVQAAEGEDGRSSPFAGLGEALERAYREPLPSPLVPARATPVEITWQDIRLAVGEGPLKPVDVLAGANAELRRRAHLSPLPQQTALVEGRGKIMGSHEPAACGASAPPPKAEPPCPKRGEIRVINGRRMRFIERELEGDKWEVLP